MELFIDLIWLLNLLFDWLVLLCTAWVVRKPFTHLRIFLASFYASLIIPLQFVLNMDWLNAPFMKLIYSLGIILIAFKISSTQTFLVYFFSFYFINFAIGGGLFAVHFFMQYHQVELSWLNYIGYGDGISWVFVLICFPIIFWFTKNRLQHLSIVKLNHENLYDVEISFNDRTQYLKGFYDTGNQLTHPFTSKPIILIDEKAAVNWISHEKINQLKSQIIDDDLKYGDERVHFIPFKKAGGEHGFLPVLPVDRVRIKASDYLYTNEKIYIGIHFGEFSGTISYNCLLHPQLFQSKKTRIHQVKGVS